MNENLIMWVSMLRSDQISVCIYICNEDSGSGTLAYNNRMIQNRCMIAGLQHLRAVKIVILMRYSVAVYHVVKFYMLEICRAVQN